MLLTLGFIAASLIAPTQATYDDMSDEDFSAFLKFHDNVRIEYGETAVKGCIGGAIPEVGNGFEALCIGCVKGAIGNVVQDTIFPPAKKDN